MVIISCAVCTKAGKILVARQYTNVSKLTLEEYVRNFPKSISSTQQHTFIENEFIRYIYLPLETMYLVLITNKNSNIIEDLETIRLVHKVVVDICIHGLNESNIQKNAFEVLLAFDDVISFGYRESVTLSQVQAALTMDSSDEKLHLMLLRARVNEAKENAQKAEKERQKNKSNPNYKPTNSFSSSDSPSESFSKSTPKDEVVVNNEPKIIPVEDKKGPVNTAPKKGLQIVKKKDSKTPIMGKKEVEEVKEIMREEPTKKQEYNPLQAAVAVEFEEKFVCTVQRDGDLSGFEVKGDIFITVRDPSKGNCAIYLEPENNKTMQLKPNPHLNKQFWTEKVAVAPKDPKDSFAINNKINCLKYRYASGNVNDLPFQFTYWFNEGSITCEIEYNAGQSRLAELNNITISFNYPTTEHPTVKNIENGDYEVSSGTFVWKTPQLDKNVSSSNIEIEFSGKISPDDIFPFAVDFRLPYTFLRCNVKGVQQIADGSTVTYEFTPSFAVERFEIQ